MTVRSSAFDDRAALARRTLHLGLGSPDFLQHLLCDPLVRIATPEPGDRLARFIVPPMLPQLVEREGGGEGDEGGGGQRERPGAAASGGHERRQARFGSAARCSKDPGVELGWRLFAAELAVVPRYLRVALVRHLPPRPS